LKSENWDQRITAQEHLRWENYEVIRLDLSIENNDRLFSRPGDYLGVYRVSSLSAIASVKFNVKRAPTIRIKSKVTIETVFTQFYINNSAQSGEWIDLLIGIDFVYKDSGAGSSNEAQPVVEITHAVADTNQAGADQIADRVLITADPRNTDIAWIDFGQAAVQDSCYPLEPGDSITIKTSNLNQINANFVVGGESVWIINEI